MRQITILVVDIKVNKHTHTHTQTSKMGNRVEEVLSSLCGVILHRRFNL